MLSAPFATGYIKPSPQTGARTTNKATSSEYRVESGSGGFCQERVLWKFYGRVLCAATCAVQKSKFALHSGRQDKAEAANAHKDCCEKMRVCAFSKSNSQKEEKQPASMTAIPGCGYWFICERPLVTHARQCTLRIAVKKRTHRASLHAIASCVFASATHTTRLTKSSTRYVCVYVCVVSLVWR